MPFVSCSFAVFFVILAILYYASARLAKNGLTMQRVLLLAASLVFYAFADLRFVPFLLYVVAVSYLAGLFCRNRVMFIFSLIADVAPLLFFKYSPRDWHTHIIFPLGLSFFTFQSISYIADCYTKKITAERSVLTVAQFICFFPVISSGPIQRADTLIPQLKAIHHFDYDNATDGMKLFAWGMFKKLCIADKIALYVNYVYGNVPEQYGLALLLATVIYAFQIYFDFSGYSDMAIGVARYLGFDAGKNFDHPYLSKSVGEFWRRWHISLSSWLRDYVYIPLGGSRVALPRIYLNLVITFLVSGIWHGSTWTFVVWGLLHGLYQCVGRAMKPVYEKVTIPAFVRICVTFCLVTFAWIFFRAADLNEAFAIVGKIAEVPRNIAGFPALMGELGLQDAVKALFSFTSASFGSLTGIAKIFAMLFAFLAFNIAIHKHDGLRLIKSFPIVVRWILYIGLVVVVLKVLLATDTSYSTNFIYQNF